MSFPTLLRLGVGHRLELRLESNTVSVERTDSGGSVSGFADLSLEGKWSLIESPGGAAPSIALNPAISLPSGTADFTAGKAQMTLSGLFGWELEKGTTFTLDTGASRLVNDAGDGYFWQLATEGAFEVPVRRDWAVSGDVFVNDPAGAGSTAGFGADVALEFYPDPDTQLDLIASRTFTGPDEDTSAQIGFSRRWSPGRTLHPR